MNRFVLITKREFVSRARQRSFVISTLVSIVALTIAVTIAPMRAAMFGPSVGEPRLVLSCDVAVPCGDVLRAMASISKSAVIRTGSSASLDENAIFVKIQFTGHGGPLIKATANAAIDRRYLWALRNAVEAAYTRSILRGSFINEDHASLRVTLTNKVRDNDERRMLGVSLIVLLYLGVTTYGLYVAGGVLEEKTSRTLDVMLSSVRAEILLAGKLIGIGLLGALQMSIVLVGTTLSVLVALAFEPGLIEMLHADPATLQAGISIPLKVQIALVSFFLVGYLSFAAVFSLVATAVPDAERVRQYSNLLLLPMYIGFWLSMTSLDKPNNFTLTVCSFVPLISPMAMFARLTVGSVSLLQVVCSLAVSAVFLVIVLRLAVRGYRAESLFRSVTRGTVKEGAFLTR